MTRSTQDIDREIVPRKGLDFHLREDDIPKYWFANDPFKTRFVDAMSLLFPEGEKFFIQCVRDYKDQVTDPKLLEEIRDFTFQEGQHSMVHIEFNNRVARQGVAVPEIMAYQKKFMAAIRRRLPKQYTLGMTAAAEHMTALMAHYFLGNPETFDDADERIRAIYFWHAIEEIEHKAVAFDVFQKVAKGGYFVRSLAMLHLTVDFPFHTFMIMRHMLKVDGFSREERLKLWLNGLVWLYGPNGIYGKMLVHYLRWYKPGYHPWDAGETAAFQRWRDAYARQHGDAIAATNDFMKARA
ncbi:MAG: metal-dependent hydrolase [Salinisphaeraceae bacterium]|nr:metal-dependent hydrolase [Salinisphaeraceae bacterium]